MIRELARRGVLPASLVYVGTDLDVIYQAFTLANGHEFCGQCPLCKRVSMGYHPDCVISTDPSMQEARRIVRLVSTHTAECNHRIITILGSRPEDFQDAILKTLEEPRPGTHLIILTTDPLLFRETVRSRCQIFRSTLVLAGSVGDIASSRALSDAIHQHDLGALIQEPESWVDPLAVMRSLMNDRALAALVQGRSDIISAIAIAYKMLERGRPPISAAFYLSQFLDGNMR